MTQSTTPTINRVNMTELTNFEYTKKWSTETDTSAPSLICNATEFWKKASQQKSPLSHKPKNKGGKVWKIKRAAIIKFNFPFPHKGSRLIVLWLAIEIKTSLKNQIPISCSISVPRFKSVSIESKRPKICGTKRITAQCQLNSQLFEILFIKSLIAKEKMWPRLMLNRSH
jgi:hypothetical protein